MTEWRLTLLASTLLAGPALAGPATAPATTAAAPGAAQPWNAVEMGRSRATDAWAKYDGVLTWGRGQTLAVIDDGCDLAAPEWNEPLPWGPKVVAARDAVDGDDDPKPGPAGYHGTSVAWPAALAHAGRRGIAYNAGVSHVRGATTVHLRQDETRSLAEGLQWVIEHARPLNITSVILAVLDDEKRDRPMRTAIDAKLATLRGLGIWVSSPCGNNQHVGGISWPASQPDVFAIGTVKPEADEVHNDRAAKTALLVPGLYTSAGNSYAAGAAMVLREAIEKADYDWRADGATLPEAVMAIFARTGVPVYDAGTNRTYPRLDLLAAIDAVFKGGRRSAATRPTVGR